jgi:hypothetical protein
MKKNISRLLFFISIIIAVFFAAGCRKSENIKTSVAKPEKPLLDSRLEVIHLYKDTVYVLSGPLERLTGEQLIIDEGTLVKVNTTDPPISIIIHPGGTIMANGNSTNPIIFTSNDGPGNQNKNWDGIVILGKSVNNSNNPNGDSADFSGSLHFVRVEFAGLVLNGVGNKTRIENVQVSYSNSRPSFEMDGGTFNARNLISYACGAPADFYITMGYSGNMQNVLAYRHPFFGKSGNNPPYNALSGLFIENNFNDPAVTPFTNPTISNLTVLGPDSQNGSTTYYGDTSLPLRSAALITTGNAFFNIRNSVFLGFPAAGWYLDDVLTAQNIVNMQARLTYSIVHSNDSSRAFYLRTGVYPPYTTADFRNFALEPQFNNRLYYSSSSFMFEDPFNYDNPRPLPGDNSPILTGANFDTPAFRNVFFNKVSYIGAVGKDNWLEGWTNFTPLKTNYNFPK